MNKKVILGIAALLIFTGCNGTNGYLKKQVFVNSELFGEIINKGYEKGVKIYSNKKVVGFLDTDDVLFVGELSENVCGGELVGICKRTNENRCDVFNYVRDTDLGDGMKLIPPAMSFECGERL